MTEKAEIVKAEIVAVNPEQILQQALDKGAAIETIQKLLEMRKELKVEWAREMFYTALSAFQKDIPKIEKRKKVFNKQGVHRYSYAPLEDIIAQVKEALEKNGFSYTLKTIQEEKSLVVICEAHHVSGHTEETAVKVPIETDAYMSAIQKIGSAITYAKRYSFCNAFGIMTADEDDDNAGASEEETKKDEKPKRHKKQGKTVQERLYDGYKWASDNQIHLAEDFETLSDEEKLQTLLDAAKNKKESKK